MYDIFDQPWTLLGLSVLVLFGVLTIRSVFPELRRPWQWLLPVVCVALAFGIDFLVQTDREKINIVLGTALRAVVERNCNKIETLLAEDYSDSYHKTKTALVAHCEQQLSPAMITKARKTASLVQISAGRAKVTLFLLLTFDKNSLIAQYSIPFVKVKTELHLQKQPDKRWLINKIEVLEVNNQPVSWRETR
jgi:hypothetical protein